MPQYPKYKPSGIEWIGDIPEHWQIKRLKRFAKICNGQDQKSVVDENGQYPIYGTGGVFGRSNFYLHLGPSVLLGRKGTIDKPRFIDEPFWSVDTSYYTDIYPTTNPKYFYYCCLTINFDLYKYGSAVPSMTQEALNQIPFACPPQSEQQSIATYLDQKTAQIDSFITKKQKLIDLLKEEKAAIINQAVTKGLDPNVKMKPSGIDWLGDIPEHWEMKKLKYLADIVLGKMLTNDDKGGYYLKPYLRAANIGWFNVDVSDVKEMWFAPNEIAKFKLKPNDLLVSEGGEVGRTCIWESELSECFIQNSVHKVTLKSKHNPIFYLYHFFVLGNMGHFDSIVNRISIAHLTGEKLKEIYFVVPPFSEQNKIVVFLKEEVGKIDYAIARIEKEIELMQEYRTALISEVVTGKVDVRSI
ncbi:MAG: hypothetical protein BGO69_18690 [Bacteroidetes bacterium 46-16]|nr:MAG: hypothetical protein BGO69_18690 [Bacteroidetes bacterium 46-16]